MEKGPRLDSHEESFIEHVAQMESQGPEMRPDFKLMIKISATSGRFILTMPSIEHKLATTKLSFWHKNLPPSSR